jgi:ribosomal protein S27AE
MASSISPIDVSGLRWEGSRTACPACGRATSLLWVLATGALACPRCAPITSR